MSETLAPRPQLDPFPEGDKGESYQERSGFRVVWRILDFLIAAVFIYAGVIKILDPVQFARDIDNYKMLPWPAAVAFGFYLPWLEVFCGVTLIIRRFYRGGLVILTGSTILFIIASVIAKARGLDISCGCFGHASKGWSFGWHLALDFGILAALTVLLFAEKFRTRESRE